MVEIMSLLSIKVLEGRDNLRDRRPIHGRENFHHGRFKDAENYAELAIRWKEDRITAPIGLADGYYLAGAAGDPGGIRQW